LMAPSMDDPWVVDSVRVRAGNGRVPTIIAVSLLRYWRR
jgi:hypothetical protein